MPLDWTVVRARYTDGAEVAPIAGNRPFLITGADEQQIRFEGRLWSDALPRGHLERAVELLEGGELSRHPPTFLESFRLVVERDKTVAQGCSRIPNMVAVVLQDLGMLEG